LSQFFSTVGIKVIDIAAIQCEFQFCLWRCWTNVYAFVQNCNSWRSRISLWQTYFRATECHLPYGIIGFIW